LRHALQGADADATRAAQPAIHVIGRHFTQDDTSALTFWKTFSGD
jgi:hypothetical protein